mmetsp:Transcript_11039/g.41222  ORF Transcript_11039/g.41222 Transcript_11039/m.41222 type:complete len:283 (-) Transcript_11039:723-1571(-)
MDLQQNRFLGREDDVHQSRTVYAHQDIRVPNDGELLLERHACKIHCLEVQGVAGLQDPEQVVRVAKNSPKVLLRDAVAQDERDGRLLRRRYIPQVEGLKHLRPEAIPDGAVRATQGIHHGWVDNRSGRLQMPHEAPKQHFGPAKIRRPREGLGRGEGIMDQIDVRIVRMRVKQESSRARWTEPQKARHDVKVDVIRRRMKRVLAVLVSGHEDCRRFFDLSICRLPSAAHFLEAFHLRAHVVHPSTRGERRPLGSSAAGALQTALREGVILPGLRRRAGLVNP